MPRCSRSSEGPAQAEEWRARSARAEAALGGDADDVMEVFELEDDGADAAADQPSVAGAASEVPDSAPEAGSDLATTRTGSTGRWTRLTKPRRGTRRGHDADDLGDPADVLEPEVAAILAETADDASEDARAADESAE